MSARTAIRSAVALTVTGAVLVLSACGMGTPSDPSSPSPSAPPSPSVGPSPDPTTPAPTPDDTTAPPQAESDIDLPGSCEQIYSSTMLSSLEGTNPPLNDPELSLLSTGIAGVYDILQSGIPTLRCTWGVPSEFGLATTVSIVSADQRASIEGLLSSNGFTCSEYEGGRMCRYVIEYPEDDMNPGHVSGETHYLQGNGWVATAWINFGPEGYTEDIVRTLWG